MRRKLSIPTRHHGERALTNGKSLHPSWWRVGSTSTSASAPNGRNTLQSCRPVPQSDRPSDGLGTHRVCWRSFRFASIREPTVGTVDRRNVNVDIPAARLFNCRFGRYLQATVGPIHSVGRQPETVASLLPLKNVAVTRPDSWFHGATVLCPCCAARQASESGNPSVPHPRVRCIVAFLIERNIAR